MVRCSLGLSLGLVVVIDTLHHQSGSADEAGQLGTRRVKTAHATKLRYGLVIRGTRLHTGRERERENVCVRGGYKISANTCTHTHKTYTQTLPPSLSLSPSLSLHASLSLLLKPKLSPHVEVFGSDVDMATHVPGCGHLLCVVLAAVGGEERREDGRE